jgi:hypothetical protein
VVIAMPEKKFNLYTAIQDIMANKGGVASTEKFNLYTALGLTPKSQDSTLDIDTISQQLNAAIEAKKVDTVEPVFNPQQGLQ